jgi:hypothetical protein
MLQMRYEMHAGLLLISDFNQKPECVHEISQKPQILRVTKMR